MTDFRTPDQIAGDLRRLDPAFSQITGSDDLFYRISSDAITDLTVSMTGLGPVVFDLGVLDGSEWEGVRTFLDSRHVSETARTDFRRLEADLRAADTNDDHFVSHQELVTFAQANTGRWPNVALFRNAANNYLNRLPSYIAQPDLTQDQVSQLWGRLNDYAERWNRALNELPEGTAAPSPTPYGEGEIELVGERLGVFAREFPSRGMMFGLPLTDIPGLCRRMAENRLTEREQAGIDFILTGQIHGIRLSHFPSEDRTNPPPLISMALTGQLGPQQLAAVHHVLQISRNDDGSYALAGVSPLDPTEIALLARLIPRAAEDGQTFMGMQFVSGDREQELFAERNQAGASCRRDMNGARVQSDVGVLDTALGNCLRNLDPTEGTQAGVISRQVLLYRAQMGMLTPAENRELRSWMQEEASRQGIVPSGIWDAISMGPRRLWDHIRQHPWNFIARNGAFMGSMYLYRRLVMRSLFESRMGRLCGGSIENPGRRFNEYERFVGQQARQAPIYQRFFRTLFQNHLLPRGGWRAFLASSRRDFPVILLHLGVFNAWAGYKDNGNLAHDVATDLPLVALFGAYDLYDAWRNPMLNQYVAANPGACGEHLQPVEVASRDTALATAREGSQVPAPENASEPVTEATAETVAMDPMQAQLLGIIAEGPLVAPPVVQGGLSTWGPANVTAGPNGAPVNPVVPITGFQVPVVTPVLRPVPVFRPAFVP